MIQNLIGMFDETGSKIKTMVLVSTITGFIQVCVDTGIQPNVEQLVLHIKTKLGIDIDTGWLDKFLDIMLNNLNIFVMFMIMEKAEKLAENMVDYPSSLKNVMKGVI